MSTYSWAADPEDGFTGAFSTRENAARAGFLAKPDSAVVWTAENGPTPTAGEFLHPDHAELLLDDLVDRAGDDYCYELIEVWRESITHEQIAALQAALVAAVDAWAESEGCRPTFYNVDDEVEHRREVANA